MKPSSSLRSLLKNIDQKGYPAYKSLKGLYDFHDYKLNIHHVQGDPFASPSHVNIEIDGKIAEFPREYYDTSWRKIALEDYLLRLLSKNVEKYSFQAKGSGKSGLIGTSRCGQEILERTALHIDSKSGAVIACLEIGFPANGRRVQARELEKILFDFIPKFTQSALFYKNMNKKALKNCIDLSDDQYFIRQELVKRNLTAFVNNGAILPRESGISQKPLKSAIPFQSPTAFEITMHLPHYGTIRGMGIPKGVTLIVGGGYHGKSTLLKALELGVYNHIYGDGREYVITDSSAVKLRAEDGRSIKNTDISLFINHLPNGKDTFSFCTDDASGSTSQAANTIEAMESNTSLFLIDEDTSATNFMIRDELMQKVILRNQEPITPFIERIRYLYTNCGISSILVAGSCGSYFHMADQIIQMENYIPKDITKMAKQIACEFPSISIPKEQPKIPAFHRCFYPDPSLQKDRRIKLKVTGKDSFSINKEIVDLRYVEQLADREQTAALAHILLYAQTHLMDGKKDLQQIVQEILNLLNIKGLGFLQNGKDLKNGLAMPRKQEIFFCFNRYRKLQF